MHTISQLFIYPIKSLAGFETDEAIVTDRGLQYDRRWMLVDVNNCFLTQREYPQMCLLQTSVSGNDLIIYHKHHSNDKIIIHANDSNDHELMQVQVWDDRCDALHVSNEADDWFTRQLSIKCKLVYMPDSSIRQVDPEYAQPGDVTAFSDGYPLLMIGQASLDDLNKKLIEPVPMERFRPNIVFEGGSPHDEDLMEHIIINSIDMYGVKLCARCAIPTIDQSTSKRGKEPSATLASYRTKNNKIYFGQNIVHKQTGFIRKGDAIEIIKTKEPLHFDASL